MLALNQCCSETPSKPFFNSIDPERTLAFISSNCLRSESVFITRHCTKGQYRPSGPGLRMRSGILGLLEQPRKETPCHFELSSLLPCSPPLASRAFRPTPWPIAAYTAGAMFAWEGSTAEASTAELTCAVAWAWAWVPLPSVQQW